jgi:hypothetical protein
MENWQSRLSTRGQEEDAKKALHELFDGFCYKDFEVIMPRIKE